MASSRQKFLLSIYINISTCLEKKSSVRTKIIAAIYTDFLRKKALRLRSGTASGRRKKVLRHFDYAQCPKSDANALFGQCPVWSMPCLANALFGQCLDDKSIYCLILRRNILRWSCDSRPDIRSSGCRGNRRFGNPLGRSRERGWKLTLIQLLGRWYL